MSSDIERKRPPNLKPIELICISDDDDDEIENKKRRESIPIEESPTPFSSFSINEEFIKEIHRIASAWNNQSNTRRQYPTFETVPTPTTLVLDCCEP